LGRHVFSGMPQRSIDDETLARALQLICEVEGIAVAHVTAVKVEEDEVEVKVAHPSGGNRILTYPLAALRRSIK
jgi:hypothetical protein